MSKNKIKKSFLGLLLLIGVFIYNNYLEEPIDKVFKELGISDDNTGVS